MAWSPWGELARRPDIWVHRCRLEDAQGWWCPQDRVILLDERLDRRTARCVLAHELAHAVLGHCGLSGHGDHERLARRQEAAADRWAADRLIEVCQVARAVAERPTDASRVARRLRVTEHLLAVWWQHAPSSDRAVVLGGVEAAEHAA